MNVSTNVTELNEIQAEWMALDHNDPEPKKARVFERMKRLPKDHLTRGENGWMVISSGPMHPGSLPAMDAIQLAVRAGIQTEVYWDSVGKWVAMPERVPTWALHVFLDDKDGAAYNGDELWACFHYRFADQRFHLKTRQYDDPRTAYWAAINGRAYALEPLEGCSCIANVQRMLMISLDVEDRSRAYVIHKPKNHTLSAFNRWSNKWCARTAGGLV